MFRHSPSVVAAASGVTFCPVNFALAFAMNMDAWNQIIIVT